MESYFKCLKYQSTLLDENRLTLINRPPTPAYALALHTASPDLGLALDNFAGDRRMQTWALGRDLSTHLHEYLQQFLLPQTWSDLAFIAVALGPGGFTGTRVGVVTARTLAQQLEIPLFAVSTLAAIAWHTYSQMPPSQRTTVDIAVEMPAQRGEIYGAIYGCPDAAIATLTTRLTDCVLSPPTWQETLSQWDKSYRLVQATGGLGFTTGSLLDLAYSERQKDHRPEWSTVVPFYGQSPV